jgi:uncharacterized protein (UPF0179 family)
MIERTEACFGIRPKWLAADSAYGSASNLDWLVNEQGIAPHVPVIDKSQRENGTFSREDFSYDEIRDIYTCPAGKTLTTTGYIHTDHALRYLGSGPECRACPLKAKCCPNMPARRIVRDVNEAARDIARALAKTDQTIAPWVIVLTPATALRKTRRCLAGRRASNVLDRPRLQMPMEMPAVETLVAPLKHCDSFLSN